MYGKYEINSTWDFALYAHTFGSHTFHLGSDTASMTLLLANERSVS
jgi:hypothetical protein